MGMLSVDITFNKTILFKVILFDFSLKMFYHNNEIIVRSFRGLIMDSLRNMFDFLFEHGWEPDQIEGDAVKMIAGHEWRIAALANGLWQVTGVNQFGYQIDLEFQDLRLAVLFAECKLSLDETEKSTFIK